jgi:hypothetical protein
VIVGLVRSVAVIGCAGKAEEVRDLAGAGLAGAGRFGSRRTTTPAPPHRPSALDSRAYCRMPASFWRAESRTAQEAYFECCWCL